MGSQRVKHGWVTEHTAPIMGINNFILNNLVCIILIERNKRLSLINVKGSREYTSGTDLV